MENITLINGDCIDELSNLPSNSVDLIITDPPYTTPTVTAFGRETVKNFADFSIQSHYVRSLKAEFERVLKPDGRLFIFCDDKYYPVIYPVFYNWQSSQLIVWDKGRIGMGSPFRKQHELLFYACRQSYEHNKTGSITHFPTIMKCAPESDKLHGAQKPLELIQKLIMAIIY